MRKTTSGFTIVELLIVIVVIGILAAITIVAYNGIQQRSNNAAVIDAASKSLRMLQAYVAASGTPPATSVACITMASGCSTTGSAYSANTTFNSNMATIGTMPQRIPMKGPDHYGIIYYYNASRVVSGSPTPIAVLYWLDGFAQQCGIPNLLADPNAATTTISTNAYTAPNDTSTGKTLCAPSLPGLY